MTEETNLPPEPTLDAKIESLLFVADGPTPISVIAELLSIKPRAVKKLLAALEKTYENRGIRLQYLKKDRVQMTSAPENADLIELFLGLDSKSKLSKAALEALAIVAYQQPMSRPQIDAVRGVNSDYVIKRLHISGLIEEVGRAETPGRPILYGTTSTFLQEFGLTSIQQLPPIDLSTLAEKPENPDGDTATETEADAAGTDAAPDVAVTAATDANDEAAATQTAPEVDTAIPSETQAVAETPTPSTPPSPPSEAAAADDANETPPAQSSGWAPVKKD